MSVKTALRIEAEAKLLGQLVRNDQRSQIALGGVEARMKTDSHTKCAKSEASYSHVEEGRREYFIPWGPYFLCDLCHRLAILEAFQAED